MMDPGSRLRRNNRAGVAALLAGLVGIAAALHSFGPGSLPTALHLDLSWTAVLGWAHATGAAFGQDVVFTYGPLGFLHPRAAYVPAAYSAFLAGQLLLAAWAGVATTMLLRRLPLWLCLAYVAVGLLPAAWISIDLVWLLYLAQLPVIACLPIRSLLPMELRAGADKGRWLAPAFLGLGAAAAALVKFTLLPTAVVAVLCTSVALRLERRDHEAAMLAGSFVFGLLGLWLVLGQPLATLPEYLMRSAEVSRGYGDAMGVMPAPATDMLGFAAMSGAGGWLGWQMLSERGRPARALLFFVLGVIVFVAWRVAYTRADGHIHLAFPLLAFAPLLGLALVDRARRAATVAGLASTALALAAGFHLAGDDMPPSRWMQSWQRLPLVVQAITRPGSLVAEREAAADLLRAEHPLPRVRERVGTSSIDLLNWEQGVVLLHGMNYRPRPVIQSYSAYTPMLQELNEAHFLGPAAPEFVLLKLQAIDGRLPAGEDALALLAILRRYQPVLEEEGFLLFERGDLPAPAPVEGPPPDRVVALGEWIELPPGDAPRLLAVDVRLTAAGQLYALWFRVPPIGLEVETGTGPGDVFRLQPEAARKGLLLSPMLRDTGQLAGLYAGAPREVVRRVRVVSIAPGHAHLLDPAVRIGIAEADWRPPSARNH